MQESLKVCECQCIAKFSGSWSNADTAAHTKYKSAVAQGLYVPATDKSYLFIIFKCNPNKSHQFCIWDGRRSQLKNVTPREKVLIVSTKDINIHINVEKPHRDFNTLSQWVVAASKGEHGQGVNGNRVQEREKATPRKETSADCQSSASPFTHMKIKQHKEASDNSTSANKQAGETPVKTKSSNSSFLASAEEKSSRVQDIFSPKPASAKKFYGASEGRMYGSFATTGSTTKKTPLSNRKPGFLDVNDKRPLLSNVNNSIQYSWGNKTTPTNTPTSDKRSNAVQGLGFSNLGNTCYMNAILQSLLGLSTFTRDLMVLAVRLKHEQHQHASLAYQIARLHLAKKRSMSRERQKECLAGVKQAVSKTARRFSGNEQHDAHELLSQVLDQMKEDLTRENKAFQKSQALRNAPSPGIKPDLDNIELAPEAPETDIHDVTKDEFANPALLNFAFEVMHTIACLKCSEEVKKTETFHDLSLYMPKRANADVTSTIQDALDQFFQSERIEYTCESCGHKQVQVFHQFYRLPRVLVLHLKRYQFHNSWTSHKKWRRDLDIPRYLTLVDHTSQHTYPPYDIDSAHPRGGPNDDSIVIFEENTTPSKLEVKSETKPKRLGFFKRAAASSTVSRDTQEGKGPAGRKPPYENSTNDTPQLRQALLSNDHPSNADAADAETQSSEKLDLHNKSISRVDLAEYTANMSEEEQMKHALEMSLQETTNGSIPSNSGTNENAHNNSVLTNGSNTNISGKSDQSHNQCETSTQTPSKESNGNLSLNTYSRKRRSKSRLHIRFSSDDERENQPETENKRLRNDAIQTNGVNSLAQASCTVSKPSDMLSALDSEEKNLTPLKNTVFDNCRPSSTPKRLDDIFSKTDKSKEVPGSNDNENGLEDVVDLTGLEDEFNRDMNYRAQDLDGAAVTNRCEEPMDQSHSITEAGGVEDMDLTDPVVNNSKPSEDNELQQNGNLENADEPSKGTEHSVLKASNLNTEFGTLFGEDESHNSATSTWSANKLSVKKLKLSPKERRRSGDEVKQNGAISRYFNDQLDKDADKQGMCDGGDIRQACAKEVIDEHREHSAKDSNAMSSPPMLLGLPRHIFDPAMTPRLSDTPCFDGDEDGDEDENANIKPSPIKGEQRATDNAEEPDWITDKRNEMKEAEATKPSEDNAADWQSEKAKEEEDLQKALQDSMLDQTGGNFDEDMKKAIELSLKDLGEQDGLAWASATTPADEEEDESFLRANGDGGGDADDVMTAERTDEEQGKRKTNVETGELPYSYRLVSVVSHFGSSNTGHYIADVYNSGDKSWYSYDDSRVERTSEKDVRANRTRTGYIFFYVNKEVQEEMESRQTLSPGSKENRQSTMTTPSKASNRVLQPLGPSNQSHNTLPRRPLSR